MQPAKKYNPVCKVALKAKMCLVSFLRAEGRGLAREQQDGEDVLHQDQIENG